MEFLATQFTVLPAFVGNKLIQVVVLIGQVDWPHDCPDLMEFITQVCLHLIATSVMTQCCYGMRVPLEVMCLT